MAAGLRSSALAAVTILYHGSTGWSDDDSVMDRLLLLRGKRARVAAAALAGGLILAGVVIATRPVGDERLRQGATGHTPGAVVSVVRSWDGAQVLAVSWTTPAGVPVLSKFEQDASPPYAVGDGFDVAFNLRRPTCRRGTGRSDLDQKR